MSLRAIAFFNWVALGCVLMPFALLFRETLWGWGVVPYYAIMAFLLTGPMIVGVVLWAAIVFVVGGGLLRLAEDVFIIGGPQKRRALRARVKDELDRHFHETDVRRIDVVVGRNASNKITLFTKAYQAGGARIYLNDAQHAVVRDLVMEHIRDALGGQIDRMRKRGDLCEMKLWKRSKGKGASS